MNMCLSQYLGGGSGEAEEKNLSFYIFILLKMVRTGSPLLLQIKIIHVFLLSLVIIVKPSQKGG